MTSKPIEPTATEIERDSDNAMKLNDSQPTESDRQKHYRREYLAQLRRRACPGCGDGDPIF